MRFLNGSYSLTISLPLRSTLRTCIADIGIYEIILQTTVTLCLFICCLGFRIL